jgi:hypothetical protein
MVIPKAGRARSKCALKENIEFTRKAAPKEPY